MKIFRLILAMYILTGCLNESTTDRNKHLPADLANPLIDTHKPRYDYFISAALPYGMVCLTPDTKHGDLWNSGYRYDDEYILDFSHVHNTQTAGIPVMPVTGHCRGNLGLEANRSRYSHDNEIAKPGYHKVFLEDYGITAELTATCRVGMHRYTFPAADEAHILFDLGAALGPTLMSFAYARKTSDDELEGYSIMAPTFRRKKPYVVHFVARFSKPFNGFAGWERGNSGDTARLVEPAAGIISGEGSGAYVTYKNLKQDEEILIKVAISYVSAQNARIYMDSELPDWNFDKVRSDAVQAWNDYLGRIRVEGGTHEQQVKLYTDLMHTASKRISSDVDGSYADWTGPQPVIRQVPLNKEGKPDRPTLDGDGLWGSQWNLNILWSLVYPEYGNWMAETFLDFYRNAGMMSRGSWGGNYTYVMVGDHATPLLAALMATGRAGFDPILAYEASRKNAFPGGIRDRAGYEAGPEPSGGGIDWLVSLGYVPVEIVSRGDGYHRQGTGMTLEYSYQDWCISKMAKIVGRNEDTALFMKRAGNWENVFDTTIGWARPRHLTGEWVDYENQPSCEMAHLFSHAGAPWKTQYWVWKVKDITFGGTDPYSGYNGDEDQGQLGALGVLMAIGLFDVQGCVGDPPDLEITSPLFDKIDLMFPSPVDPGKNNLFTVLVTREKQDDIYIQGVKLNGEPWNSFKFPVSLFLDGGKLEIDLGPEPNKNWSPKNMQN